MQSKAAGYSVSRAQITHILNASRKAGPDACVAIAYGLGLPREEVFRARGWLLREPRNVVPPESTPKAAELIRTLTDQPDEAQEILADALLGVLRAVAQVTSEKSSETPSETPQEPPAPAPEIPETVSELLPFFSELDHLPKPIQRETIDTLMTHLATTLRMNQRVEHLSNWFRQEFPDRHEELLAQLDAEYDADGRPIGVDPGLKRAA